MQIPLGTTSFFARETDTSKTKSQHTSSKSPTKYDSTQREAHFASSPVMARGSLPRPPLPWYAAQKRSPAEIAAGVAPTHRQFELAVHYADQAEVLAFLTLDKTVETNLAATNAYVVLHGDVPRWRGMQAIRMATEKDPVGPYRWLWPEEGRIQCRPVTLFKSIVANHFVEVLEWFIGSPARVARIKETLACVLPETLWRAARANDALVVEVILTSPAFATCLTTAHQQQAMERALSSARHVEVGNLLVAHGTRIDTTPRARVSLQWALANGVCIAGEVDEWLLDAAARGQTTKSDWECLDQIAVLEPHVLCAAVTCCNTSAVERLLADACIDVDARLGDGRTLLMESMFSCNHSSPDLFERHRQITSALLAWGVNPELLDAHGHTALHLAIRYANLTGLDVLLEHTLATRSVHAIHSDRSSLAIAWECLRGRRGLRTAEVLLSRGACSILWQELVQGNPDQGVEGALDLARRPCTTCKEATEHSSSQLLPANRSNSG